ncbi:hypothetical protein [Aeropyrum camini]|uniref:hypothetical protein n=1 Tax=Aeropyrum camini TaxID=229980 RepID=UPI0034E2FABE
MSGSMAAQDAIEARVWDAYGSLVESSVGRVRSPEAAVKLLEGRYRLVVDKRVVTLVYAAFLNGRPVLFEGPPAPVRRR